MLPMRKEVSVASAEQFLASVSQISQEIYKALAPFKKPEDTWKRIQGDAWDLVRQGLEMSNELGHVALETTLNAARDGKFALTTARSEDWEIVKNQLNLGKNPFRLFLSLYKLGVISAGFRQVNDGEKWEEKLVIDMPFGVNSEKVSACLVFSPDGSYDRKVLYVHDSGKDCRHLRPVNRETPKPHRQIR